MGKAAEPPGWREKNERVQAQLQEAAKRGRMFYGECWCGWRYTVQGGPGAPAAISNAVMGHQSSSHPELWREVEDMYRMGVPYAFVDIFLNKVLPKTGGDSA